MEMWFGMDDEVSRRRRSVVRRSRLDMSLLQEEFSASQFERFRTFMKVCSLALCRDACIIMTNCMEQVVYEGKLIMKLSFMQSENSLLCPQETATGLYLKLHESSPHPCNLFM